MVRYKVAEACRAYAASFGVKAEASGVLLLTEHRGRQSLRNLVIQGYQVITF